jgi:hypothetical protein
MRRGIAVSWHALSFLLAAILYFVFVLPRWWELMGDVSHTVGTTLRIITGVLIGLTALPVALNLVKARKPEFGTPQLALTLRVWSVVGHVLAGVLIVGTAVTEIWVDLDSAGQWLFGVYGAAAALAVLGAAAFYLAFVAETPPPPPKPLKPKKTTTAKADEVADETEADVTDDVSGEVTSDADTPADTEPADEASPAEESTDEPTKEPVAAGGRLRNRRPSGKSRGRSGGVTVSDD